MGLRFIYGPAGTGKTTYCFNEIKNRMENEEKIYIITPEQFSFTAERKLLEIIPKNSVLNTEVITFNRIAYRVFTEVGGASKTVLSETGNSILIYSILEKNKKNLKFLGKSEKNIELISRIFTELKKHQVKLTDLENIIKNLDDDIYLKTKIEDIYILYKNYEEILHKNYIDSNDVLTLLIEKIDESKMFNNSVIYIDEFAGFTKQEYMLIKKILQKAKQVNITICSDWLENNKSQESDIFYQNKITAQSIVNLIENEKIESPVILKEKYRFKNDELKHLEENLYENEHKYKKEVENIEIFLSMNPYTEIEYVAKEIIKLIRDENYNFKDIAIITKQIENYSGIAKAVFSKYEIPVFIDEKKDLSKNSLIKYILSIFEIYSKNFSYEPMFNYIKTGFIDISQDDIFKLENYCIKWGIKGSKWYKEDWNYGNLTQEELVYINNLRKKIITPLIELKEEMSKTKTAEGLSKNMYNYLNNSGVLKILNAKIKEFKEKNLVELSKEYETGINTLMQVLDELVMIFNQTEMSFEKYRELLKIGLQNKDVGVIPATQDQVTLGDTDRSRSHNVKVVFIIGVNDGTFPNVNSDEGFLDDKDREELKAKGIELAKTNKDRLYEEQFNIYKALTVAENKLYISYTSSDLEGRTLRPSILITKIKKIFPYLKENSDIIKNNDFIGTKSETFDELLNNMYNLSIGKEIGKIWREVYEWYNKNDEWKTKLETAVNGINYTNLPENINQESIEKLYGNKMKTSISKLEQYRTCPFSFHLKYGLRLKEDEKFELKSIDTGSFMHEIIDDFFEKVRNNKVNIQEITEDEIEKIVYKIVDEKLTLPRNAIFISTKKFKILLIKLKKVLVQSIKYIVNGLKNSKFKILGNEVEFKEGGSYTPIEIELEDGKKVEITGKIDRIDIAENENGKYIRIIDYKSSVKNIDLNEVMFGLQLQLITYLDEVTSKSDFIPAGVLYFNLIDPIIKTSGKIDSEKLEEEIRKNFKMKGIVLADLNVIKMMDKNLEKGYSENLPIYIDKDGNISENRSSTLEKDDFINLQKKVKNIIKQISKEIYSGDISIKPYYKKDKKTPCEYCKYKAICNFNTKQSGNNYNYIRYLDKKEVLEKIRKEAKNV